MALGEETVDLSECLASIQRVFLPEIDAKNVTLVIAGKTEAPLVLDPTLLGVVLYNIFDIIMQRCMKNHTLKIQLIGGNPTSIIFYDDGYDLEDKRQQMNDASIPGNIFCLSKAKLRELVESFGWCISFESAQGAFHSLIKLTIPWALESQQPSNVVNLFDSQAKSLR